MYTKMVVSIDTYIFYLFIDLVMIIKKITQMFFFYYKKNKKNHHI